MQRAQARRRCAAFQPVSGYSTDMAPEDREQKRAWKETQKAQARAAFPLADDALAALFAAVEEAVDAEGCSDTRAFSEAWLAGRPQQEIAAVLAWLDETGGFCDCEVVANSGDHWASNR